jgi:tubulin beta
MGTKYWGVVCDEKSIGGDGEYSGGNDAHLGRINVFYHEALGGKYGPRTVFFDLEPGVIGAARASPLGDFFRLVSLVNQNAGSGCNWAKGHRTRTGHSSCTRMTQAASLCSSSLV